MSRLTLSNYSICHTNDYKVLKFSVLKLKQVIFKKEEVASTEKEEQKTKREGRIQE